MTVSEMSLTRGFTESIFGAPIWACRCWQLDNLELSRVPMVRITALGGCLPPCMVDDGQNGDWTAQV